MAIESGFVRTISVLIKKLDDRLRAFQIGETQTDDPIGIFDTFFINLVFNIIDLKAIINFII